MRTLAFAGALVALAAAAAEPTPQARTEIDHLMAFIASSDCRFFRNGSWHGMDEARAHVAMKYGYLRDHGEVSTAEDFIERAASRSSLSGKDYRVRCPGMPEQAAGPWLRAELARFRAGHG